MNIIKYIPIFDTLINYDKKNFRFDLIAALTVLVTILTTIFAPHLEQAIYAGVAISILLYLKDSGVATVITFNEVRGSDRRFVKQIINGQRTSILVFQLEGNLYFGSSADLEMKLSDSYSDSKVFLIRFKGVSIIDITALEVIEAFINRSLRVDKRVILSGVTPKIHKMLNKMHITDQVGNENIYMEEDEVYTTSRKVLDEEGSFDRNASYTTGMRSVQV